MKTPRQPHQGIQLWRYGIISEFLHGDSSGKTLGERLAVASGKQWIHPDGRFKRLSADTLRHWIYRYRKSGLDGLGDQTRSDNGSSDIPDAIRKRFRTLREENPHFTTERVLRMLTEEGSWKGSECSRSAFYRYTREQGLGRVPTGAAPARDSRAFEFSEFGQMWTADFLHGPCVRMGKTRKKTYLFAIIDDASRYIVHAKFYWSEGVESMLDGLAFAIRRFGVPHKFYTDNGSAFRSDHLKIVAGRLAMHIPHTPPYRPQGRGKIERFFRTVRDQWLPTEDVVSRESLNDQLAKWLDHYHHSIHDSLKASPLARRLAIPKAVREVPEVQDLERKFRMHATRLVNRNGTVSLEGRLYDVHGAVPGQRMDISYLPWDLKEIWVGHEMTPTKLVDLAKNATYHINNPIQRRTSTP